MQCINVIEHANQHLQPIVFGAPQLSTSSRRVAFSVSLARCRNSANALASTAIRSEEHTSELQSRLHLVCRLLLEKKKTRLSPQQKVTNTVDTLLMTSAATTLPGMTRPPHDALSPHKLYTFNGGGSRFSADVGNHRYI